MATWLSRAGRVDAGDDTMIPLGILAAGRVESSGALTAQALTPLNTTTDSLVTTFPSVTFGAADSALLAVGISNRNWSLSSVTVDGLPCTVDSYWQQQTSLSAIVRVPAAAIGGGDIVVTATGSPMWSTTVVPIAVYGSSNLVPHDTDGGESHTAVLSVETPAGGLFVVTSQKQNPHYFSGSPFNADQIEADWSVIVGENSFYVGGLARPLPELTTVTISTAPGNHSSLAAASYQGA